MTALEAQSMQAWFQQMRIWIQDVQKLASEIATAANRNPFLAKKFLVSTADPLVYYHNHGINTGVYASLMGRKLDLQLVDLKVLVFACMAHDIGNANIADAILLKPGALTKDEMNVVKEHTRYGHDILEKLGCPKEVCLVALQHHERLDGSGYPTGLEGDAVHEWARICAIADSYDALKSHRPHEAGAAERYAREVMATQIGKYDPRFLPLILAD